MVKTKLLIWISFLLFCGMVLPAYASESDPGEVIPPLKDLFWDTAFGGEGGSEGRMYYLGEYFFEDPVAFIRTLAQESSEVQEKIIERAPFPVSMYHDMYPGGHAKFPEAVASIALTEEDSENAHHILQCFRDAVDQYWGTNPKTGDPAGVAAALLAASGAGLTILPKLRKKEE